jgi:hypothetical protein
MVDRNTLQNSADTARINALAMYEEKIAAKTISASEMGAYMKLLQTMGLEAPAMQTFQPTADKTPLPSFEDEDEGPIPHPSSKAI